MATQTLTTASGVLKEFYLGPLRNVLNNTLILLAQVEHTTERVEGKTVVQSVKIGRNQGIGARAENASLPTAGYQVYKDVRSPVRYNYGSFELSGPTIKAMQSDRGSFTRPVRQEMEGLVQDLKNDMNRQLYGSANGANKGDLIQCGATTTSATVVVSTMTPEQKRQIVPGMVVDVMPLTGAAVVSGAVVQSVTATTVVLDSAITTTTSHYIFRAGARDNEVTGLRPIVAATGTLFGVDPTVYPLWASYVKGSAGAISEDLLNELWQESNLQTDGTINLFITTSALHRKLAGVIQAIRRFPATNNLRAGYKGMAVDVSHPGGEGGDVSIVYDKDCQTGTLYGLDTTALHWDRMSDWEFMEEDGGVLQRATGSGNRRDAYEATLFVYADLTTHNRGAHAIATGVT